MAVFGQRFPFARIAIPSQSPQTNPLFRHQTDLPCANQLFLDILRTPAKSLQESSTLCRFRTPSFDTLVAASEKVGGGHEQPTNHISKWQDYRAARRHRARPYYPGDRSGSPRLPPAGLPCLRCTAHSCATAVSGSDGLARFASGGVRTATYFSVRARSAGLAVAQHSRLAIAART